MTDKTRTEDLTIIHVIVAVLFTAFCGLIALASVPCTLMHWGEHWDWGGFWGGIIGGVMTMLAGMFAYRAATQQNDLAMLDSDMRLIRDAEIDSAAILASLTSLQRNICTSYRNAVPPIPCGAHLGPMKDEAQRFSKEIETNKGKLFFIFDAEAGDQYATLSMLASKVTTLCQDCFNGFHRTDRPRLYLLADQICTDAEAYLNAQHLASFASTISDIANDIKNARRTTPSTFDDLCYEAFEVMITLRNVMAIHSMEARDKHRKRFIEKHGSLHH